MEALCAHLAAEQDELDGLLTDVAPERFDTPTPAQGWDIRDQVTHLAFGEELAGLATTRPTLFRARLTEMTAALDEAIAEVHARGRLLTTGELLDWWRAERERTRGGLAALGPRDRVPWAGPDLSAAAFARARLMETFAHGQDIRDALGVPRAASQRLFEVAHLGVRTRGFSYRLRNRALPQAEVRVELDGPGGPRSWGPPGAAAAEWMEIAQAYLGPPEDRRPPRSFPVPYGTSQARPW